MSSNDVEEATKKRHSAQVVGGYGRESTEQEQSKKLRLKKVKQNSNKVEKSSVPRIVEESNKSPDVTTATEPPAERVSLRSILDLESAIHSVVQASADCTDRLPSDEIVSFRVGHNGDSSALAACIRKLRKTDSPGSSSKAERTNSTGSLEDTSLEVKLAEGLGDEDNPPCVFALFAEVHTEKDLTPKLGAAALLAMGWDERASALYVEWLYVDVDLCFAVFLKKLMLLRLSAIALLTSSSIHVSTESD
jgi:hypothetical protein